MNPIVALALLSILSVTVRGQFHAYNLISDPAVTFNSGPGAFPAHYSSDLDTNSLAHPAVVANAAMEGLLPAELKNKQYKNPTIAAGLAEHSWFGYKEMPVGHRDADDIPRSEIFKIFQRAGFSH